MNMLLHGMKDTEFEIFHGDTLLNQWALFNEMNPAKKVEFDAIVANPPFSLRWEPNDTLAEDFRFKSYGLAPKSAAEFAFLLHGFHFLGKEGTMAIILPHGVLFRGGAEGVIRTQLIRSGYLKGIIGLPANLFYGTGIPACILVLDKENAAARKGIFMMDASKGFMKDGNKNRLRDQDIHKIVDVFNKQLELPKYSRMVSLEEIADPKNDYNLNIPRYVEPKDEQNVLTVEEAMQRLRESADAAFVAEERLIELLKKEGLLHARN
jgi:type I restriction enzyme M protein